MYIFTYSLQILEVLLESCTELTSRGSVTNGISRDLSLQAVERVVKATVLGYLLPVQVTALTHDNLRELNIAEKLMPQIVRLVVLASQVWYGPDMDNELYTNVPYVTKTTP